MKRLLFLLAMAAIALTYSNCNEEDNTYSVTYVLETRDDAVVEKLTYTEADGTQTEVTNPEGGFEIGFEVEKGFTALMTAEGTVRNGEAIIRLRVNTPDTEYTRQDQQGMIGTTIPFELRIEETIQ